MKRLILAGAGHAHLHVLKALAARPLPGVEIILVAPYARQIYSGMLPGWIAGHYRLEECAASLAPLAQAAGVRLLADKIVGVDASRRVIQCADAGELSYDVLSLNCGAQVDASSLAATGAVLLPIRPLERFVAGWAHQLATFAEAGRARVAVVGAGAAGVELALAMRHRLAALVDAGNVDVVLVEGAALLAGHGPRVVRRVERALAHAGVRRLPGYAAGAEHGLLLANGDEVVTDCVVATTGVSPPSWLAASGLALADDGFVAVADGQRCLAHANVFAAGDVASRVDAPHARSGVYAVRAGPILAENLPRALAGNPIIGHAPQRRSLYLLATGPKHAIASWSGWTAAGAWVWRWKDWIDRGFMKQYVIVKGGNDEPAEGHYRSAR